MNELCKVEISSPSEVGDLRLLGLTCPRPKEKRRWQYQRVRKQVKKGQSGQDELEHKVDPRMILCCQNTHSCNIHLLSAYYVPGTVLSDGDTAVLKTDKNPFFLGSGILEGK